MYNKQPIFTFFLIITIILLIMVFVGLIAWIFGVEWGGRMFGGSLIVGFLTTIITIMTAKADI